MLEGFSTVLVAFFVFCLYRQDLIRSKKYYYATFGCLILIIFCNVFFYFMSTASGQGIFAILLGLLHVLALILTMAYIGGIGVTQIGQEIAQVVQELQPKPEPRDSSSIQQPEPDSAQQSAPIPEQPGPQVTTPLKDQPRIIIDLSKKS